MPSMNYDAANVTVWLDKDGNIDYVAIVLDSHDGEFGITLNIERPQFAVMAIDHADDFGHPMEVLFSRRDEETG